MSRNRISEIGQAKVRGGIEVSTYKRSARGTKYRGNSIVVITRGLSPEEVKASVALAVEELLENPV